MPASNLKALMCLVSWAGSGRLNAGVPYMAMGAGTAPGAFVLHCILHLPGDPDIAKPRACARRAGTAAQLSALRWHRHRGVLGFYWVFTGITKRARGIITSAELEKNPGLAGGGLESHPGRRGRAKHHGSAGCGALRPGDEQGPARH